MILLQFPQPSYIALVVSDHVIGEHKCGECIGWHLLRLDKKFVPEIFLKFIYKNGKNCGLLNATFISKKLIQFSIKEEKEQTSLSNFAASNNSWNCAVFTAGLWN